MNLPFYINRFYMKYIPDALTNREPALSDWHKNNDSGSIDDTISSFHDTYIPDVEFGLFKTQLLGGGEIDNRFRLHEQNFKSQFIGDYANLLDVVSYLGTIQHELMELPLEKTTDTINDCITTFNLWASATNGDEYVPVIINSLDFMVALEVESWFHQIISSYVKTTLHSHELDDGSVELGVEYEHEDQVAAMPHIYKALFGDYALATISSLIDSISLPDTEYFKSTTQDIDGYLIDSYMLVDGHKTLHKIDPNDFSGSMASIDYTILDEPITQFVHELIRTSGIYHRIEREVMATVEDLLHQHKDLTYIGRTKVVHTINK